MFRIGLGFYRMVFAQDSAYRSGQTDVVTINVSLRGTCRNLILGKKPKTFEQVRNFFQQNGTDRKESNIWNKV